MRTTFAIGLALGMLVTGSVNTISTKLADLQVVAGLDPKTPHAFNHPFFQASLMFLGEALCLAVYNAKKAFCAKRGGGAKKNARKNAPWSPLIFLLPACCDCKREAGWLHAQDESTSASTAATWSVTRTEATRCLHAATASVPCVA